VYQPLGGRKGKPVIPKIVFFPTNLLEFFAWFFLLSLPSTKSRRYVLMANYNLPNVEKVTEKLQKSYRKATEKLQKSYRKATEKLPKVHQTHPEGPFQGLCAPFKGFGNSQHSFVRVGRVWLE
jgi:hypothetical protein